MRYTTCTCTDGQHNPQRHGHSVFRSEADAAIIARHTGRHVVPVSELAVAGA